MTTELKNAVSIKPATSLRHHSPKLVSEVQGWIASIDWPSTNEIPSVRTVWSTRIKSVAAEGAFLGFARVVRLCRALHAAIVNKSADLEKISVNQKAALMRAILALGKMLPNPRIETFASLQILIHDLQTEFQLTEEDLSAALLGHMDSAASELTQLRSESLDEPPKCDLY